MRPGEQIDDYTIVSKIGEGGMSVVYLATHTSEGTPVVVKELRDQYQFDQQLIDRFRREAAILQELRHPHLARVYGCPKREGRYYMIQEYLSGGSLSDLLRNRVPYTEAEAIGWCCDALRAMNYVHENGIVHRDLKPSNLMLDSKRQIRVIDFGIARAFGEKRLTRTSDGAIGTLEYMSPEQILTPDNVDHLTDVYSMGIVLYELLTGEVPFEGPSTFAVQEKITRYAPPPLRQFGRNIAPINPNGTAIDPRLAKIVLRALDKRPERRFGGCAEFAMHLGRFSTGRSGSSWIGQRWSASRHGMSAMTNSSGRRGLVAAMALLAVSLLLWRLTGSGAPEPGGVQQAGVVTSPIEESAGRGQDRERLEAERAEAERKRQDDERRRKEQAIAQEANQAQIRQQQEKAARDRAAQEQQNAEAKLQAQEKADRERQAALRLQEQQNAEKLQAQEKADRERQAALRLQEQQNAEKLQAQEKADRERQAALRLQEQQNAEKLQAQEKADREHQAALRLQEQQAANAKRLAQEKADRQAALRLQEQQAADAKRLAQEKADRQAAQRLQEQQAADAKRQEQDKAARERQEAELAQQRLAQEAAARFFATIKGTWTRDEEEKTDQSRRRTVELLTIDASGSGVLTRTVTTYEKGFAGWKPAGSDVSRFSIRCDAAGRVSGDLNGRISLQGPMLLLGTSSFERK